MTGIYNICVLCRDAYSHLVRPELTCVRYTSPVKGYSGNYGHDDGFFIYVFFLKKYIRRRTQRHRRFFHSSFRRQNVTTGTCSHTGLPSRVTDTIYMVGVESSWITRTQPCKSNDPHGASTAVCWFVAMVVPVHHYTPQHLLSFILPFVIVLNPDAIACILVLYTHMHTHT